MNATAQQVPQENWGTFFGDVSRLYEGWSTSVEVLAGKLGDHPAMDGLPLQEIDYETQGSQAGDIRIEAGDAGTAFDAHVVHHPRAVRVLVSEPGSEVNVELEAADGTTSIVHLRRRPALGS
jgi:hypothetical protein